MLSTVTYTGVDTGVFFKRGWGGGGGSLHVPLCPLEAGYENWGQGFQSEINHSPCIKIINKCIRTKGGPPPISAPV